MKGLRKIGRVLHLTKTGNIVVEADPKNLPKIGSSVVNRKNEKVGFVYDIIGPTKSPFVIIRPYDRSSEINELFVVSAHGGEGKSKGKGNRKEGSRERGRKKGAGKRRRN